MIFVEGGSYKKLIARNEKPLDAKELAKEQKHLQQAAIERRKRRSSSMLHKIVSVGT